MMRSWRDTILQHFVPQVNQLTLVADPDALLTEELLAIALRQRGFDLLEFNDPVEFRYVYETNYRAVWDRGGQTDLMVIVRVPNAGLDRLPYDLLANGRALTFDLGALFPRLSYAVIETLERQYLDAVFEAQVAYAPDRLGNTATQDFLLRHVFGIASELINTDVDLLRCLLRCHYNRLDLPDNLSQRLIQIFRQKPEFASWPLERIVAASDAFFVFLQERWPLYLNTLGAGIQVKENAGAYPLRYAGPEVLPFAHHDICVYLDNLFMENRLAPVPVSQIIQDVPPWVTVGIITDNQKNRGIRAGRLWAALKDSLPPPGVRYSAWLSFALKWAELNALMADREVDLPDEAFDHLAVEIDQRFSVWLKAHYAGLVNLPPAPPVMVHHLPRYLARSLEESPEHPLALIVVDGLALDQWVTMRRILTEQDSSLRMRESAVFAWIPTLTSVSRQAIFAGKSPLYFASTIGGTDKESHLWRQFWEGLGISRPQIAYKKGLGDGQIAEVLEDTLYPGHTRIIGLVVDKVDKIMHGMQLGTVGMHNQIQQWCQGGFLASLLRTLLDHNFQVWLTSDHGNIECTGTGRLSEGAIAETRGERVRIYPTPELLASVVHTHHVGQPWSPIGLPQNYYPLIAEGRSALVTHHETLVAHGGIALEEVIVPFVKCERR